jgi:hypothetical protein
MSESKKLCRHWVLASLWAKPLFDTLSKVRFLPYEDVHRLWYFACYHSATSQHEYPTSSHCDNISMLRAQGYVTLPQLVQPWVAAPSPAWLSNTIASMTQQHCHQHNSACTLHCDQVTSAAPSPAWLGSTVISMTQHLHHTIAKWPW